MPPWPAIAGYGQFANDNSLTLRETQFIVSWVEGLGPRNAGTVFTNVVDSSGKAREAVRAQPHSGHWQLGEPDLIRSLEAQTIDSGTGNAVRRTVLDPGLRAERRVRAVEYMPGDRRVVRAAFFTLQETGQWIGAWTPWYGFMELPAGAVFRIPAGAHVVAEIHYKAANERVVERGSVGMFFDDKPGGMVVSDLVLQAEAVAGGRFRRESLLTADVHAAALRVETAAGVKSVEVSSRRADGGTDVLLFAKDIPAEWPTPYIFKKPVLLRRGSRLAVTSYGAAVRLTVSRF
jgi:hypothetical protein